MSERQGNLIIALLCLNFAYDAIKLMITMYYDHEDRREMNRRLDRLEEFLVRKTVVQCSYDCCEEDEEEEEEEEEAQDEGEEEAQDEGEEEAQDEGEEEGEEEEGETQDEDETQDEEESETFIADDGAVYAYKISLNTAEETRTVERTVEDSSPQ